MILMFLLVQGFVDLFKQLREPYPEPQDPQDPPYNRGWHLDHLQLLNLAGGERTRTAVGCLSDRVRDHHHQCFNLFTFQ